MHRLALALGRTVAELNASMSVEEFEEWMIYSSFEPWGSPQADQHWRQYLNVYWSAKTKERCPDWFDRDPEETMRLRRLPDRDLAAKIEATFEARMRLQNAPEGGEISPFE